MGLTEYKYILLFILITSPVFYNTSVKAENIELEIEGNCTNYNATVIARGFKQGCYDTKVDVTSPQGRVGFTYNPRKGWKSSFYYIEDYLCFDPNQTKERKEVKIKVNTKRNISFKGKLRKNQETWESDYYDIEQNCPKQKPTHEAGIVIIISLIALWIILIGITIYHKGD